MLIFKRSKTIICCMQSKLKISMISLNSKEFGKTVYMYIYITIPFSIDRFRLVLV